MREIGGQQPWRIEAAPSRHQLVARCPPRHRCDAMRAARARRRCIAERQEDGETSRVRTANVQASQASHVNSERFWREKLLYREGSRVLAFANAYMMIGLEWVWYIMRYMGVLDWIGLGSLWGFLTSPMGLLD